MNHKKQANISLIGLGAIGCAFASQAQNNGFSIKIICDKNRKVKYGASPFLINDKEYDFHYISQKEEEIDLLLVCVKFNQLEEAIEEIRPYVSKNTIIVSLLNGINSEDIIEEKLQTKNVIHAFTVGTDSKKYDKKIRFTNNGKIVIGTPFEERKVLLDNAFDFLRQAGLPVELSDDINRAMWWKLMVNVGINQIAALHRIPYGIFSKDKNIKELTSMAMKEVVLIANTMDIDLNQNDIDELFELSKTWGANSKASMLQDIENQRQTEVDMFAGEICRLGAIHNIPTPINRFLFHSIKYIETFY